VEIQFDLRWEIGARYRGGGAYIPNCYLYVPNCTVLWGFTVDASLHVGEPKNAGDENAPNAALPLTISATVTNLIGGSRTVEWDFVLMGDGNFSMQ
jgi:hypothetical protein